MYQYTFKLQNNVTDHMLGDTFSNVVYHYIQKRGDQILQGQSIANVTITGYPMSQESYNVDHSILQDIVTIVRAQNSGSTEDENLELALKIAAKL